MKSLIWIAVWLLVGLVVLFAAFRFTGPDRVWRWVAGSADLGAVDFATLTRPSSPNTFLVCPEGVCGLTTPDLLSPVYGTLPEDVMDAAINAVELLPRTVRIDDRSDPLKARFVVRSRLMRFPDTVSIEAFPGAAGGPSTEGGSDAVAAPRAMIAIYSRSQLGYGDMGVNANRVRGVVATLAERLPVETPARPPG